MPKLFSIIIVWAEAWAPLIPIYFLIKNRNQPRYIKPVIVYILMAFPLLTFADFIGDFRRQLPKSYYLQTNIYLYNILSVIRFVCFSYFFISLRQQYYAIFKKIIPVIYLMFLVVDLTWFEYFFSAASINSYLLLAEAFLLMIYCLLYFLSKARDENDEFTSSADIYVVTGLSMYVVANFSVYLYYDAMLNSNARVADQIWSVSNIVYILFCVLIAKAFSLAGKVSLREERLEA